MNSPKSIFCFGYGYTAAHLAGRLRADSWRIAGTTRDHGKVAAMRADDVETLHWRGERIDPKWLNGKAAILVSTPPDETGCPALNAARDAIKTHRGAIKWLGYLSSNSVYGDHDGAWVDEETPINPITKRGERRAAAEESWRIVSAECGVPVTVFRLPGIYGPGRSILDAARNGTATRVFKESHVVNRAHVDDIVSVLTASLDRPSAHKLFNIADDEPAPSHEVVSYVCSLLGVEPPPLVPLENTKVSNLMRSYYQACKRISNRRIKDALGVTLKYPTYREGLAAVLAAEMGG